MTSWRSVPALALAGVLVATSAFAQATTGSPPKDQPSSQAEKARGAGGKEQVKAAQQALKDKGLYDAEVDGIMGPRTREAVREFQKTENLKATGRLDAETLARLGVERTGAADTATSPAASPRTAPGAAGKDAGGEKK